MSSDEEDVVSILVISELLRRRKKRRFQVRPYLQRRNFNIYQELKIEDRFGLRNFFRCSETDFEELLSMIRVDVEKSTKWRSDVVTPEMRLGITLRFLATGDSFTSFMYYLRISKQQLSLIIPEVCWALYNKLKGLYLKDSESDPFNFIPMNPAAGQWNERVLNLDGPVNKKPRNSPAVFSYVKKLSRGGGGKIIRIEVYDADTFADSGSSQCKCDAELCIQHVVKNMFMDDKTVRDIAVKISETMEI